MEQISEYTKKPFWPGWKSFKFNGPGVCYEVSLCICTGNIVWIHGPFPCGQRPDIKVFRHALICELEEGEKVQVDLGYRGEPRHVNEANLFLTSQGKHQKSLVRSQHETINKRFKQWNCLHWIFCHHVSKHGPVFRAVAVITQLALENGEPLFGVAYNNLDHF